jgi:hypothetical protein
VRHVHTLSRLDEIPVTRRMEDGNEIEAFCQVSLLS